MVYVGRRPFGPRTDGRLVTFLSDAVIPRQLYAEFRDTAITTRDPVAIGWLFLSLASYLKDVLGYPDRNFPTPHSFADVSPRDFTQQFLDHFDIPRPKFIAALPSTSALINRSLEHFGPVLTKFTGGDYSGYVLNELLRVQLLSARGVGPTAVWDVVVPAVLGGEPKNMVEVVAPISHTAHEARRRAFGEGTIGTIGAVAELYIEITTLAKFAVGRLRFISSAEFKVQFCRAWEVKVLDLDAAVMKALEGRLGRVKVEA
ncbi:hypothetical protein P7C70_g2257, partial [Phenoliferia sp. Uapishka_3]